MPPARPIVGRASCTLPCPVCGTGSKGCSWTDDGQYFCRDESADPTEWVDLLGREDNAGFHHYRRVHTSAPKISLSALLKDRTVTEEVEKVGWKAKAAEYVKALDMGKRADLARQLGLEVGHIKLFGGIGWTGEKWSFPERNGRMEIIGISTRNLNGTKLSMSGSKRGLSIPAGWRDRPGPVLIVEGPSDTLAGTACNLSCIGRPSNVGGSKHLVQLFHDLQTGREIVVFGENDRKPDGKWPGQEGAEKTARNLSSLNRVVKIAYPPAEYKDLRAWVTSLKNSGGDENTWATVGQAVLKHIERTAVMLPDAPAPAEREPTNAATIEPPTDSHSVSMSVLEFRPFPVDELPEPVRSFVVSGAKSMICDPSYIALPLLVALASAIGNTRRLELKRGWSVPPILWGAVVGESGTTKSPALKLVMRPFLARQGKALKQHDEAMKQYDSDLARCDKETNEWTRKNNSTDDPPEKPEKPEPERFIVIDTTVEALAPLLQANTRGLLLFREELRGWFGSFDKYGKGGKGGADAANWLSMHSAECIMVDRKTGTPSTIHIPRAAMCVIGGIQPGILKRALDAEQRDSGLAARLLVTNPPRKAKRWTEADIDPKLDAELARLLDRLYELIPTHEDEGELVPRTVRLGLTAKSIWITYYNAHNLEQTDLAGDLAAAWSKLEEYAARLALVIHFIRWAAGDTKLAREDYVDGDSMKAGITLVKWFKHEARRVYAMLDESDIEGEQRRLVEWIERKGGTVSERQVQQGCRWLKETGAAQLALKELVKAGLGTWREHQTTEKGGRPTRVFVLSTPSTVNRTPKKPE